MDNQATTISRGAVAEAAAQQAADPANRNTGSQKQQPSNDDPARNSQQVEDDQGGAHNSGRDGNGDGSTSGNDDQTRQPRGERRISQLHGLLEDERKKTTQLEDENQRLKDLLENPLDTAKIQSNVQLPDRSSQQQITNEEYKSDVVNAATQIADAIVKQRLGEILPENNRRMSQVDNNTRVLNEMQNVLDPNSPDYIPQLDQNSDEWDESVDRNLASDWNDIFKGNPKRSFKAYAKEYVKQRGGRVSNNTNAGNRSSGTGALRQTGGSKSSKASATDIAKMSASEYATYIKGQH